MALIVIGEALAKMEDLTVASTTQGYKLGKIVSVEDTDTKVTCEYIYVKAHGALTQYQPYVLGYTGTSAGEIVTAAPATIAAPGAQVVIPQVAIASGSYGFVLISGTGSVLMIAETYAVGDMLQILNTGTALVVDGSTGSTVYSINTCAVCRAAGSTAVAKAVMLLKGKAVVAAS